uniref:Uncharacterized protein n=1 Tax=Chromera velia CCMP2878 TaxID=1169474 RepID=A0A0G4HF45_9ALVE|eukprot:Cvel_6623.t1-p1 / transcript=Cvel_6623.t1 / gene=Cvel_6623 / organism=Chromera_velia_CCMP2878 / gene_product=hypothetical protein / transcript_product=hypothetical protein / location=Cvel_scaffold328:28199-29464(-) / protein_length=422 / sequence_SO=supercontig / SO=protein_coding / is_pseudo=false
MYPCRIISAPTVGPPNTPFAPQHSPLRVNFFSGAARRFSGSVFREETSVGMKQRLSAAERMAVEHEAKRLIRCEIQGLMEEPSVPLPHSAKADMALRPIGCEDDLWLPLQLKATRGGVHQGKSVYWVFRNVGCYPDMLVICVSLEEGKVWAFSGRSLQEQQTLRITAHGKHDGEHSRCFFERHAGQFAVGRSLRHVLLSTYAEAARGSDSEGVTLQRLKYLREQVCGSVSTEEETREWLQPFFDAAGLTPVDAGCSTLPYDLLAGDIKFQLKTSAWNNWTGYGPLAFVSTRRKLSGGIRPYVVGEYDVLLVGPPRNFETLQLLRAKHIDRGGQHTDISHLLVPRFFYIFHSSDLVRQGCLALDPRHRELGQLGMSLDFIEGRAYKSGSVIQERLPFRFDLTATSLEKAASYVQNKIAMAHCY